MKKRGRDIVKLTQTLAILAAERALPPQYRDHQLKGSLTDFRECHIDPDWLLMYQIFEDKLILSCMATGTHDDLFKE
jgi:mRNA interferase YafQ